MSVVIDLNDDRDYLSACMHSERWAQELLYKDYYSSMMSVCVRYSNDREDALDILHEGFIKIFTHINKYQVGTSLNAWMKRIMVNTAIDYYRKRVRRRTEDLDSVMEAQDLNSDILSQLSIKEILESINELSHTYRSIFNLYVIEGYPHKEIADILGISESTSRSNLVKARAKLRSLLAMKGVKYGSK